MILYFCAFFFCFEFFLSFFCFGLVPPIGALRKYRRNSMSPEERNEGKVHGMEKLGRVMKECRN